MPTVLDTLKNCLARKLQKSFGFVLGKYFLTGSVFAILTFQYVKRSECIAMLLEKATYLVLSYVNMIHIHERYRVSILVIIEDHTDFIEYQLYIEPGCILVQFMVHYDLIEASVGVNT